MSEIRAAKRYAKSLLELAEEKGQLEAILSDMQDFNAVCKQNHDFVLMLKNPIVKHDQKKKILFKIFAKANKITLSFYDIITRKNREAILPAIAKEFINQYNVFKRIEIATVTTAVKISADLRKELEKIVLEISDLDTVQLQEIVDEELIGGFILKVGDRRIDDSLKSKLKALEVKFSHNPYIKEI